MYVPRVEKRLTMKENGNFKWYLSWWFMLILFVPTIGIGTIIIGAIRLIKSIKAHQFKAGQMTASLVCLLLGLMMFKFMITPNDPKMPEVKEVSYTTTKPEKSKVVKATSKPSSTSFKYTDDEIVDAIYAADKKKCSEIPEKLAYKAFFNSYRTYIKEGNRAVRSLAEIPEAFLKMYGNVNKDHTKTMKDLKKYGNIVQKTSGMLPCNEEWVKKAEPFCTNYNYYNLYTGNEILLTPQKIWGREFEYGYIAYVDDEEYLLLTNKRLSKSGRQELKVIDTGKKYTYDTYSGYSKKLEMFIIPDDEEIEVYEDDVKYGTPDELNQKKDDAFNNIKKILGV